MEFKNCVEQVYMYLELKDPTGNSDVTINSYVSNHTPCEEVGFELEVLGLLVLCALLTITACMFKYKLEKAKY